LRSFQEELQGHPQRLPEAQAALKSLDARFGNDPTYAEIRKGYALNVVLPTDEDMNMLGTMFKSFVELPQDSDADFLLPDQLRLGPIQQNDPLWFAVEAAVNGGSSAGAVGAIDREVEAHPERELEGLQAVSALQPLFLDNPS